MKETLKICRSKIGSTKDEEKRGRVKNTIRYGYQCINTSGGGAAKSIVAFQKSGQIIEWWERRWRTIWWCYLQNLQDSWIELTEKSGYWSQCDICDEYIWLKGHSKRDMSADNNFFFVAFASDHNYQSQIFIQLSTRALNYAMKLSTVIESLLISIHWLKIF